LDNDHFIPFICLDNPLVYVLKAKEGVIKSGSDAVLAENKVKSLQKQFEFAAESLDEFFKELERFPTVLTKEFNILYQAKSKVEADIILAQDKL